MNTKRFRPRILPMLALALLAMSCGSRADSTISSSKKDAWGANIGWTNWNWNPGAPEGGDGASVSEYFLSGMIYGANVGWINLGGGTPANGIRYQNIDLGGAVDFGVNHDGAGGLSGLAWGANIGWIVFDQTWTSPPRFNIATGRFTGYAYSANCGWINLGNDAVHFLATTAVLCGNDVDADGINDAWENEQTLAESGTASTTIMDAFTDSDVDGVSDLDEYTADTNPFDAGDVLQLLSVFRTPDMEQAELEWAASPRRSYHIQFSTDLAVWDNELKNLVVDGPIGAAIVMDERAVRRFWRVLANRPLRP